MLFKDVLGQDEIKSKLINNIRNNRISHAQLFLGPRGSGNLPLALAYARYLACKNPGQDDSCGICPSCIKFNKYVHPDINFFFPIFSKKVGERTQTSKDFLAQWREFLSQDGYISLTDWYTKLDMENKQGIINAEDCNDIIRTLRLKSNESEYKIIIIWMIEKLYYSAAPKLLKILEEPPENTVFLLVSENQDMILNTILSRAQLLKIPRLKDEDIEKGLRERMNADSETASQIAMIANGDYYLARQMLENNEREQDSIKILREWLRSCFKPEYKTMFSHITELSKLGREKQKVLLGTAVEIFRQSLLVSYDANALFKTNSDYTREFVNNFAGSIKPEAMIKLSDIFSSAIHHIERNANPKILFTDLSLQSNLILRGKK